MARSCLLGISGLEKPWKSGEAASSLRSISLADSLLFITVSCLAVALWLTVSVLSLEETGILELEFASFRGIVQLWLDHIVYP